jgi:orotate phosphoribosyltransferase
MDANIARISYALAIIAGVIIGFVPAPWGRIGLVFVIGAFALPLFSYAIKVSSLNLASVAAEQAPSLGFAERAFLAGALTQSAHIMTGGTMGDYYLDIDLMQTDHREARFLAMEMTKRIHQAAQILGGVDRLVFIERDAGPVGAISLLGALTIESGIDAVIVRPKRLVRKGIFKPPNVLKRETRVVLVTDVITGGGHIRATIEKIRPYLDQEVFPVVSLACREYASIENLKKRRVELFPIYGPDEVAQVIAERKKKLA